MPQLDLHRSMRWLGVGLGMLFLAACQPPAATSDNPIESYGSADADDLLGAWYGELNGYEAYVHVIDLPGADSALQTFVIGHRSGWGSARAIPADIQGTGYLSIEIDEEHGDIDGTIATGYHLVRYRVGRGYITLYAMDESMIDNAIDNDELEGDSKHMRLHSSSDDLVDFIERIGGQDLFSVQIGYLERIDEEELPSAE